MKTEHKFAFALKSLMAEKPLDEISVLSLCRRCHVNRQTFYYHYHDIYDLLTQVFLDERIDGLDRISNYYDMLKLIYSYYDINKRFIDAALASAGKDLVKEFFYNVCYQSTLRIMNSYEISKNVDVDYKKNVARFYASGFSNSIIYYFINAKRRTLGGLINCFNFVGDFDLLKIMQNIAKNRKIS